MNLRRFFLLGSLLALMLAPPVHAADEIYTNWRGLAIRGYDPVAYFTQGEPVEGDRDFEYEWKGATWRFATAENREAFIRDPESYVPQYGGYCAWAVSQGKTASIDPEAWRIVDGKLYLNYSAKVQRTWEEDIPGFIKLADANWSKLRDS